MKKRIPIPFLYRFSITRRIIANLVCTFKIKKNLHAKFIRDLNTCYPISSYGLNKREQDKFYKDFLDANMKHGVTEVDYFTYEYYLLSDYGRSQYLTERDRGFFHRNFNDKENLDSISDKYMFYQNYCNYINRKIMLVNNENHYSEFVDFCKKTNVIIVKPVNGEKGQGVHKIIVSNDAQIKKAWNECLENHYLVEEVLVQDSRIAIFHPDSINTIRIATAVDNHGEPHIMAAVIRCGANGTLTDNASAGGLFAGVDVDTGIIISKGLDLNARPFLFHPTTGVLFLGYQIPKWEELKQLAKEVAKVNPKMRYIGWDWVLTKQGKWELLEGNEPGGAHIIQQGIGHGLFQDYYQVLAKGERDAD